MELKKRGYAGGKSKGLVKERVQGRVFKSVALNFTVLLPSRIETANLVVSDLFSQSEIFYSQCSKLKVIFKIKALNDLEFGCLQGCSAV